MDKLIQNLQIKKPPVAIKKQEIKLKPAKKEEQILKTNIIDKRQEKLIDRTDFLSKLQSQGQQILPLKTKLKPENISSSEPKSIVIKDKDKPIDDLNKTQIKEQIKKGKIIKKKMQIVDEYTKKEDKKVKLQKFKPLNIVTTIPEDQLKIDDKIVKVKTSKVNYNLIAQDYYLNNRKYFINFINNLFNDYRKKIKTQQAVTCGEISRLKQSGIFELMPHQEIVKDYINIHTPYRGLLIYHGLGAGKTCSSIAIAEGLKTHTKVFVLTPASLAKNYYEEIKNCGDILYKKNQHWKFIESTSENINILSQILSLSVEYIKKQKGAWLVEQDKKPNINMLNSKEKNSLDSQLNEMINQKYNFISYNGLRMKHIDILTKDSTINPFNNTTVIIDEAHNFISRIVNKLKYKESLSKILYELLMTAENCKIIFLTGTPIINYPNEIAVLFNILRGYIKVWNFKLSITESKKINLDYFKQIFNTKTNSGKIMDYINYNSSTNILTITKNPFGFVNKNEKSIYKGLHKSDKGEINDSEYLTLVKTLLKNYKINIIDTKIELFKALPDDLDEFKSKFIDPNNNVMNMNLFKKRILGLTSYFISAQEKLMPKFNKLENFNLVMCDMSVYQLGVYETARTKERKLEKKSKKKQKKQNDNDLYNDTTSTYKIFSRAFCNFVFPDTIKRPMPKPIFETDIEGLENIDEDVLDSANQSDKIMHIDGKYEADEIYENDKMQQDRKTYDKEIKEALIDLELNAEKYLTPEALKTYSPKFLRILEFLSDKANIGCHLIYSQFRSLEGIGILKLVLNNNGYAEFKIKLNSENEFVLDILDEDMNKPKYVLYTGTETSEYKEIYRNIFNGDWKYVPVSLQKELLKINKNNLFGEVIKAFMITASGAEGISLKNTRYVHIVEPYWHPVRINQIIGRARRICSHEDLPEELQNVEVFLYLMNIPYELIDNDLFKELRRHDISKITGKPISTDQSLFEIANIKEEITNEILKAVKESSIDCSIHNETNKDEKLNCFTFGDVSSDKFGYKPNINFDDLDDMAKQNIKEVDIEAIKITIKKDDISKDYAYDKKTNTVYDYDLYMQNKLVYRGKLYTYFDENNRKMLTIV